MPSVNVLSITHHVGNTDGTGSALHSVHLCLISSINSSAAFPTTTFFVTHISSKSHLNHSTERGKKRGEKKEEGRGGRGVRVVKHSAGTKTFAIPVHKAYHKRLLK
jgi:hypothetical protein